MRVELKVEQAAVHFFEALNCASQIIERVFANLDGRAKRRRVQRAILKHRACAFYAGHGLPRVQTHFRLYETDGVALGRVVWEVAPHPVREPVTVLLRLRRKLDDVAKEFRVVVAENDFGGGSYGVDLRRRIADGLVHRHRRRRLDAKQKTKRGAELYVQECRAVDRFGDQYRMAFAL